MIELLNKLEISYKTFKHKEINTIFDAKIYASLHGSIGTKNILLNDKKNNYILVIMDEDKRLDVKKISEVTGFNKLSFTKDIFSILGVEAGSVGALALINSKIKILVVIDKDLENKEILQAMNSNCESVSLNTTSLIKFIEYLDHEVLIGDI